jgi:hypothetical protein
MSPCPRPSSPSSTIVTISIRICSGDGIGCDVPATGFELSQLFIIASARSVVIVLFIMIQKHAS